MKFINSINHFRALSIILIVMGHLYTLSGIKFDTAFENILGNIITGGTFNFVFVSGFLFNSVFYKRFNYKFFIINKAKRVFLPYIILSFLPILISIYLKPDFWVMSIKDGNVVNPIISFVLFSILFFGVSKKAPQNNKTDMDKAIATNTFLLSIIFLSVNLGMVRYKIII